MSVAKVVEVVVSNCETTEWRVKLKVTFLLD
jgi:flavin-binding protein dodecin